jgi:transcriptional regulator with XRE-family HTH domain
MIPGSTTRPAAKHFPAEASVNKRSPTAADKAVGANIRALRRAAGMTLQEIGEAVGVSFVQFQRYETGVSRMSASRLIAISIALGVRIDSLIGAPESAEAGFMSDRERGESAELAHLFKAIANPTHRQAILALARTISALDTGPQAGPEDAPANASVTINGSVPETKQ